MKGAGLIRKLKKLDMGSTKTIVIAPERQYKVLPKLEARSIDKPFEKKDINKIFEFYL